MTVPDTRQWKIRPTIWWVGFFGRFLQFNMSCFLSNWRYALSAPSVQKNEGIDLPQESKILSGFGSWSIGDDWCACEYVYCTSHWYWFTKLFQLWKQHYKRISSLAWKKKIMTLHVGKKLPSIIMCIINHLPTDAVISIVWLFFNLMQ